MAGSSVEGGVRTTLRVEGLAILMLCVAAYARTGSGWMLFALLFLVPDLSFAAFLFGPRIGAAAYNTMHSTLGPLTLGTASVVLHQPLALAVALIWLAHAGFDRAMGYGLKYATGFTDTHLGHIGRKSQTA
ncbi:MAG TPA: DUF4260 domain-containing protein [Rhizomicrobium sp.]|jgi:hypothetical protein